MPVAARLRIDVSTVYPSERYLGRSPLELRKETDRDGGYPEICNASLFLRRRAKDCWRRKQTYAVTTLWPNATPP